MVMTKRYDVVLYYADGSYDIKKGLTVSKIEKLNHKLNEFGFFVISHGTLKKVSEIVVMVGEVPETSKEFLIENSKRKSVNKRIYNRKS